MTSLGIAIPSLGHGEFVATCLASVKRIRTPFRAIVQDGGSDAATLDCIQDAIAGDDRFRLVVADDAGQSDAINRAWAALRHDHPLLTWINTDDVIHADQFDLLLQRLHADPRTVVGYGDFRTVDVDGQVIGTYRRPARVTRSMLLHWRNDVPGVGMAMRTDAMDRVGHLDAGLHFAMDFDLWVRLSRVGALRRLAGVTGDGRLHEGSKTTRNGEQTRAEIFGIAATHRRGPPVTHHLTRTAWRAVGRVGRTLGPWREDVPPDGRA